MRTAKTIIPYSPRPLQRKFHLERKRFCVLLCHRRFGKTVAAINDLLRNALKSERKDWRAAYMAPFVSQAKAVAWDYLQHFAGVVPGVVFNKTELSCMLPNGARIRLFGTDNANALRGMYLDDVVLDEPADMPREVWTQVLRPMLADRKGRALFSGTPAGTENLLYDVWELAGKDTADWSRFMFKASETGYIDDDELKDAKGMMHPDEYEQEFECSFSAGIRGAYYATLLEELEQAGRRCDVPYDCNLPVHTSWDLGMNDSTAIWFFQIQRNGDWRVLDYYEQSGEGLQHYVQELQKRPYVYGRHIAPHDIRVRELGTGKSRYEVAKELGVTFDIAPSLALMDGIGVVRSTIPRMWFDREKTDAGFRALKTYRKMWRPREERYADRPLHDWTSHAADSLRYGAIGFKEQTMPVLGATRAKTTYNMWA